MTAATVSGSPAADQDQAGPAPARPDGPSGTAQSAGTTRTTRTVRSWPLLVLAAPAAAEVWSGWVGVAQKTGFGIVSPLPGIWPALHLDTAITLPVGVEAYAALALRAWLSGGNTISRRTRQFAKWSAILSLTLGMAGQVASHLMDQAQMTRAPWTVTTLVSCLPVLVLAMGTALAHLLREDATAAAAATRTTGPAGHQDQDQDRPDQDQPGDGRAAADQSPPAARAPAPVPGRPGHAAPTAQDATGHAHADQARAAAARLAASGTAVSRRTLRNAGIQGSNEALNALARMLRAELAGHAPQPT